MSVVYCSSSIVYNFFRLELILFNCVFLLLWVIAFIPVHGHSLDLHLLWVVAIASGIAVFHHLYLWRHFLQGHHFLVLFIMLGWPRTAIVGLRAASIAVVPRNTTVWSTAFRTLTQYGLPSSSSIPWNYNGSMPLYSQSESKRATTAERPAISVVIYGEQQQRPEQGEQRHGQLGSHAGIGQQVRHDEHWLLQQ